MDEEAEQFIDFMREKLGDKAVSELYRSYLGLDGINENMLHARKPQLISENKNGVIYNE